MIKLLPRSIQIWTAQLVASLSLCVGLAVPGYRLIAWNYWYTPYFFSGIFLALAAGEVINPRRLLDWLHRRHWRHRRMQLLGYTAGRGHDTTASGLPVGYWAGSARAYLASKQSLPRPRQGESRQPTSRYLLTVSSYRIHGNEYRFGFANGEGITYFPTSGMLTHPCSFVQKALARSSVDSHLIGGKLLEQVIDALARQRGRLAIKELPAWPADESTETLLLQAIEAAELWGLVVVESAQDDCRSRLLSLLHLGDRDRVLSAQLELTSAGVVWQQATYAMYIHRRRERLLMNGGKDQSVNFHGSRIDAPVTVAGGDIKHTNISHTTSSTVGDNEVLGYLTALLASEAVPWHDPQFVGFRPVVADAVTRSDVRSAGIKTAVNFFLGATRDVVVRVLGEAGADGLRSFYR